MTDTQEHRMNSLADKRRSVLSDVEQDNRHKQAAAVTKNVAVRAEAASNTVSRKVTEEDAWDELHGDAELLTEIARARRRAPSTESQMTSGCLGYQGKEACDAC